MPKIARRARAPGCRACCAPPSCEQEVGGDHGQHRRSRRETPCAAGSRRGACHGASSLVATDGSPSSDSNPPGSSSIARRPPRRNGNQSAACGLISRLAASPSTPRIQPARHRRGRAGRRRRSISATKARDPVRVTEVGVRVRDRVRSGLQRRPQNTPASRERAGRDQRRVRPDGGRHLRVEGDRHGRALP